LREIFYAVINKTELLEYRLKLYCKIGLSIFKEFGYIAEHRKEMHMRMTIVIEPDGDGFHAKVPALPGCGTWGKTETEARNLIKEAIQLYLDSDKTGKFREYL
jgi:predicted RNase H-like HicB family nuclease